ncbi:MAG: VCBS repeat-containing protein [Verrucomicrobia bacterium]|nr:VCBS repeat-containing protein [Verrucomicrobiota bacterium]
MRKMRAFLLLVVCSAVGAAGDFELLRYNHPGLRVDLGVGLWAWPLPMDFDGDGDMDLVVSCPDKPHNGTYFFENPGPSSVGEKTPAFKSARRLGPGFSNITLSWVEGRPRVLLPGEEIVGFLQGRLDQRRKIYPRSNVHTVEAVRAPGENVSGLFVGKFDQSRKSPSRAKSRVAARVRANQWKWVDYDGDGALDLAVGVGWWGDYGWDNAFNVRGQWTNGPLHGFVYLIRNRGSSAKPRYAEPVKLTAGGKPIDVFGMPSPNFADFDGDGDLDLLCGEFIDGFTYFENVGSRRAPQYAPGRRLAREGKPIRMPLCMIVPAAVDWDRDGDVDLIVGQEDGRVAFLENTGRTANGMPVFRDPRFFKQEADAVKFGALATPACFDWDGDGDEDILCGDTAGEIGFIENLGGFPPRWAAPRRLRAGGKPIRIMAGPNGSIQGPAEAKWGYTVLSAADWDHDGLPDIVANSIWGRVVWFRNIGTRRRPKLAPPRPIQVEWPGRPPKPAWNWWNPVGEELVTQWRTTPAVVDWNRDGINDLVMLDHEGYLAFFRRVRRGGKLLLLPGERIFRGGTIGRFGRISGRKTDPLRLNDGAAGKSGRRKFCVVDWDGDGRRDLIVDGLNADFLRNVGERDGAVFFERVGPLGKRRLAGHTSCPTTVDWNRDGAPDLLVGAEDGFFYYLPNPRSRR